MKSTMVLVFCFLWVFVFADNNQNPNRIDDPKVDLVKSSIANTSLENEVLFPEVLVDPLISGKVKHAGTLTPFAGVTVTFTGGIGSVVTDDSGYYEKVVPYNWSGSVTPYYCGFYNFVPSNKVFTNVKQNKPNNDFVGSPAENFIISGTIINACTGLPLTFYTVDFGNGISTTTNSQGQYTLEVAPCKSYVLTPISDEFDFIPLSRSYTNVTEDFINQDYEVFPILLGLPSGWSFVNTGNISFNSVLVTANPNFCGVSLQAGDWIGVFFVGNDNHMHCGGAAQWTGTEATFIAAQGDDTQTTPNVKDGFAYAETMNWRLYSVANQQEYPAFPVIQSGGFLKWYPQASTIVTSLPANKTHSLQIPQGWSGISSYIAPRTANNYNKVVNMLAPIASKLVILQNLTTTYWPSQGINTIVTWNSVSGYKIKVTEAVTLPITGCDYTPKTVSLVTGWNLIPVLSDCNVAIESLFAANLNKISVIKEVAGSNIYWPAVNIKTLLTLQAGKAYLMRVTSNFSVTFPACTSLKDEEIFNTVIENNSPWNDPLLTPSNHSIALPSGVFGKLMVGDVIGAFTEDGFCAGIVEINDLQESVLLQVYGDDQTTFEKDGFDENEALSFKLFRPQINQEFEIGFDFDATMPSTDAYFYTDGLSAVSKIFFNPTYIGENANNSISFFPNPGKGLVEFVAGDSNRKFNVTILDLTGQKAFETTFSGRTLVNLSEAPKGIYIVKIESGNFVKVEKLIIQ